MSPPRYVFFEVLILKPYNSRSACFYNILCNLVRFIIFKLAKVEIGMTQEQVIYVLGSPMLIDQFDSSTWYYIRYIKPGGEEAVQSKIVLSFENKKLVKIVSDNTSQANPLIN